MKEVNLLAILIVGVVLFGVIGVIGIILIKLFTPPYLILSLSDILFILGAFMMVLIAIEIFNCVMKYLRTGVFPISLIISTALMAVARMIIVFDYSVISLCYVYASAVLVLSLGFVYYLIIKQERTRDKKSF